MFKFIRKIRQKIIYQGDFRKYLLYAIGEIFLIVLGILIALQINNWNEARKLHQVELDLLKDIKKNLIASKFELQGDIQFNTWTIKMYQRILSHIQHDLPYSNSLDSAFSVFTNWSSPFLIFNAYETLKYKGIELIKNDTIKDKIIHLYEFRFAHIVNDYDKAEWDFARIITVPFSTKNINYPAKGDYSAKPFDFENLKTSDEFQNILNILIRIRSSGVEGYNKTIEELNDLIEMIDRELDARKL